MEGIEKKVGFFQNIWEKIKNFFNQFDIESWYYEIRQSTIGFVIFCFVAGFAVGFLFKKYFKFLFFCLAATAAILIFLNYKEVITIDWEAFKTTVGITAQQTQVDTLFETAWRWIQIHAIVTIATILGFLFGYKLG